jgi:hypothetical protein
MPVPESGAMEKALFSFLSKKGEAVLYGPMDHASGELQSLLGIRLGAGSEGDFRVHSNLPEDTVLHGKASDLLRHAALVSGGMLNTYAASTSGAETVAAARNAKTEYAYGTFNGNALGGKIAWVRGSFPAHPRLEQRLPGEFDHREFFMPGGLFRAILTKFSISLSFTRYDINDRTPLVLYSFNNNACYITGYAPDTTCSMQLSMPDGAPLMTGTDCIVRNDTAEYTLNRWWHQECRVFVRQKGESKVSSVVRPSVYPGIDRRMYVTGLIEGDVIFRKVPGTTARLVAYPFSREHHDHDKFLDTNVPFEELPDNRLLVRGISCSLMIAWGENEYYKRVYAQ